MIFDQIPAGTAIFIDANIFVYHFLPHPTLGTPCKNLLERVSRQEIRAATSTHVLADVGHRLMTMEAAILPGWSFQGIAQRLRRHHAEIAKLSRFQDALDEAPRLGIQALFVTGNLVSSAAAISRQHELLMGDALVVAMMRAEGLSILASHDSDSDRVAGIVRHAPL